MMPSLPSCWIRLIVWPSLLQPIVLISRFLTVHYGPDSHDKLTQEGLAELEKSATKAELDRILTRCGASRALMASLTTVAKSFGVVRSLFIASTVCFFKGFGAHMQRSGGTVDMTCAHLVPYAMLPVAKSESPRDVAALLAMMRHLPNVSLYDYFCGGQQALLSELSGIGITLGERVGAVCLESQVDSLSRFFPLSVPGLATEGCPSFRSTDSSVETKGAPCLDVDRPPHPVSQSKTLLLMHDSFHGSSHAKCRSRDTDLIKETRTLDTARQEHRNKLRLKTDPFLRNHTPHRNMMFNLILAHRLSRKVNLATLFKMKQQLKELVKRDPSGSWCLILGGLGQVIFSHSPS